MIVNEYALPIASGSTFTGFYAMKNTEYLAGFHVNGAMQGNMVLQDALNSSSTFRDVYVDNELRQWTTVTSGQFHRLDQQAFHTVVRFRTTSAQTAARTIVLRTVEL
jgi:hypothetical protein